MKTEKQIIEWLNEQPWRYAFYEAVFFLGNYQMYYDEDFLRNAFDWDKTSQGRNIWEGRDEEYQKWYNSNSKPMSWEEYCKQSPIKEDVLRIYEEIKSKSDKDLLETAKPLL